MKKILLFILFTSVFFISFGQQTNYWQQKVNYNIDVTLNDSSNTLDGYIRMMYFNNAPDTLRFIWFHVWPNAYKNDRTAFSDQLLENGRKDFYFSNDDKRGYINRLDFRVDKITASIEEHPKHQDIIKIWLPKPLAPGNSIKIETPFHVQLPTYFSRSGHIKKSYQITQWYPKPAVYDKKGWHEMPYLDQGEFYSEFGEYEVQITLPNDYIVAATGKRKDVIQNTSTQTLKYKQENIHDFAWFADKDFSILHDTLMIGNRTIDLYSYFNKANAKAWTNSIKYIKSAIITKSNWVGDYPYDIVRVVEKPGKSDGGGMEYPTITLIDIPSDDIMLDELIYHEVGHNWFYGILASNERQHPWMDEGINSYYDQRYKAQQFNNTASQSKEGKSSFISNLMPDNLETILLESIIKVKKDQPIETISDSFSFSNYGLVAYFKTAQWLKLLESTITKTVFDNAMQQYFEKWKFRHPYPEDFKKLVEEVSGKNLDSIFSLLNKKGFIQKQEKKDIRIKAFFSLKETEKHNYIFVSPLIGYNYYDKFMIGALVHNYTLPVSRFLFVVAPLYATGSKKLNGIGRLAYSWYPGKNGSSFEMAVAGSTFTVDQFTDPTGKKNYLSFQKIVPTLKYIFAKKYPRSTITKYLQWKTFLISETGLSFNRDTVNQIDIISYPKQSRYLNQLQFVIENNRTLYPYNAAFTGEQGNGFIRLNFTGNYFFNYAKGGGLNLRFFAGKFIYTGDKTFITQYETDRYHINLSGAKGYEDYTYSNYFVGRNEFEGLSNQQIMNRDGAFKVRTDLLSNKIGKSDDWLSTINLTSSIPKKLNPLELLPFKIPLRVFLNVGTFAEAWKAEAATGRFLYEAGFQLSLFKEVLNIYFPVLYSKVYRDYFKSTITEKRFLNTISFSIDIQNISFKRFFPQISL